MIRHGIVSNDLQTIYEINETCHPSTRSEPRISILEKIRSGEIWVCIEGGKIIGFLIGRKEGTHTPANIYNIAVLPEHRGQGLAKALIYEFEEFYKGKCVYYYLHVDAQNPAQKLYFDLGYRVLTTVSDFYGDDTIALRMMKPSRI